MPYPRKLLNDNETVALDVHPHWWYFAAASGSGSAQDGFRWVAVVLVVGCAAWFVIRYLKWRTTNFVITSDRVIFRHGVFAKSGIEIPLERVNNVNFHQRIFERIIGAGDLLIESAGQDGRQRFTDVRHPDKVQNLIHSEMEANQTRMYGGGSGATPLPPPIDVASQLEKLEGMLHRGSLSQDEFDAQKRKLLGT
jgi:membrane protein YdbS with pleckstrin-like domain